MTKFKVGEEAVSEPSNTNVEHIYTHSKYLGIGISPCQSSCISNAADGHIIPEEHIVKMGVEDMKKYIQALQNVHSYEAGGLFGWSTAYRQLAELGFEERTVRQGHRAFVSMVFNPQKLNTEEG